MSSFDRTQIVEAEAMKDIVPFLHAISDEGRYVLTHKGNLSRELQKSYGDAMTQNGGKIFAVEFKAEEENKFGNFFLETWSNRKWFTPGWMLTLNADVLLYYFLAEREMYSMSFKQLRTWAFHEGRIYQHTEKKQNKHQQLNDTWGRCVNIGTIGKEVGFRKYRFTGEHGNFQEETV